MAPPTPTPVRKEVPRWLAAIWGAVLLALNLFMVVYLIGFSALFGSFSGGPAGPSWLTNWFFDDQAFFSLFTVVAVAVGLSFAFMGLSALHAFAWSGLPMERKLLWVAVVFAGAQPGMLVYWFMNVWRKERTGAPPREVRPPTAAGRVWVGVLGFVTILPILYFAFFFLSIGATASSGSDSLFIRLLPVLHLGVIFLSWGLTAFYIVHVFRTPRLEGITKAVWAVVVAFGGPIGWPIYWYMNMWRSDSGKAPGAA